MNPMTNVRNIKKLSEEELRGKNKTSWHQQYRSSAWIFVGGLPYDLTEGDIICVFSQYGEPVHVNLVRDKETGKSKGFCFICFEDQRSTDLAVDNLNGIKLLGRTLRVDHVEKYKPPKGVKDERLEVTSKTKKEKRHRERAEEDPSSEKIPEDDAELNERRTKNKETCRKEDEYSSRAHHNRKKKDLKVKKKRKKRAADSDRELEKEKKKKPKGKAKPKSSDSGSSLSSSTSSSSSSSRSSSSSSSSSSASSSSSSSGSSSSSPSPSSSSFNEGDGADKRSKRTKTDNYQKQKRNRTIEDLKREARLIQAELKRRQQIDEQTKRSRGAFDEKHHSRSEEKNSSRVRSNEKDERRENSKDRQRNVGRREDRRREDRRDRSNSPPRDRRRSRTPERPRENGHRHRHR